MFIGTSSITVVKSVPWSRLKPRRKYWFALPDPECWTAIRPGTASSNSATRSRGRTDRSAPPTAPSLAASALPISASPRPTTTTSSSTSPATAGVQASNAGTQAHRTLTDFNVLLQSPPRWIGENCIHPFAVSQLFTVSHIALTGLTLTLLDPIPHADLDDIERQRPAEQQR